MPLAAAAVVSQQQHARLMGACCGRAVGDEYRKERRRHGPIKVSCKVFAPWCAHHILQMCPDMQQATGSGEGVTK